MTGMTPEQRELYLYQQDTAESFYDLHPDVFTVLTCEELALLDRFYFLQHEIDVPNIAEYAVKLLKEDPSIWQRAEVALQKVCNKLRLDHQMMQELFPKERIHL